MYRKNPNPAALLKNLKKEYPNPQCALHHDGPFQLLVATILSAQCTDERVNRVTQDLFKKYKTPGDFARVSQTALEQDVHSTGFYRNKAKSIREMAELLLKNYGGKVPDSMEHLLLLPGVARKTANVVLGTAFGLTEGVVVDTHVLRLSKRLGLSQEETPQKVEQDLMKIIPKTDWIWFSHALIHHGRRVCKARNPDCPGCPVRRSCANPEQ